MAILLIDIYSVEQRFWWLTALKVVCKAARLLVIMTTDVIIIILASDERNVNNLGNRVHGFIKIEKSLLRYVAGKPSPALISMLRPGLFD